jgi:polysaccharide biosynthesis protein PslG
MKTGRGLKGFARVCAATLAICALGAGASASTALAVPSNFWGVDPQATPTPEQFQRLKEGGVDSVRVPVAWGVVQPTKGSAFDWSSIDPVMKGAALSGIEVLPFLTSAPSWAVPTVLVNAETKSYAPKNLPVKTAAQRAGWTAFVREAVLRYGPQGTFWTENPTIPQKPIRLWQIWNEENTRYFVARPDAGEYGKLVKLSSSVIKGADPGAKIILGGIVARPKDAEYIHKRPRWAYFGTEFLEQMYKRTPGIKQKYDGVAIHPYTTSYKDLTPAIEEIRTTLKALHDPGEGLWLTEIGWSSDRPNRKNFFNSYEVGPQGQARELRGAFNVFRKYQARWRLKQVYWFSVDDAPGNCNFCDGSGLFGSGFKPKPAWRAFVGFTGGRAS